jgi:hypothetical protein
MLRNIKQHLENHPNMSEHPSLVALDQLADDLESGDKPADYESAVREDADINDLKRWYKRYSEFEGFNGDKLPFGLYMQMAQTGVPTDGMEAGEARQAIADQNPNLDPNDAESLAGSAEEIPGVDFDKADAPITNRMKSELATIMGVDAIGEEEITKAMKMLGVSTGMESNSKSNDGELARLKELSGIRENAKVNFSPEQIKQLMMWNKKYSVYSGKNGDELPSGLVKANTDSGITSDGYEENEVKQYEKMFGKEEFDWDDSQHGEFQEKSKITGGMMSDLEKIVGVGNADDEYTLAEIGEKILGMSFGDTYEEQYKPADYESAVKEDSGELARLKELSGIREDAGLTDQQKKGLEAIAKKYKDREGGNGDMLAYGYLDAYVDTGITTDGYDSEEMEVYSKKIGKNSYTDWEGDDHSNFVDQSEITSAMIDDLEKVLGPEFENDAKLSSSAMEYLNSLGSNYEPMPEGDEFDIEEDEDFEEVLGPLGFPEDETELFDAEYQGRKVPLNKPMRGDSKKFKVYVKDPKTGNVKKVNFGHGGTSAKKLGQKTMKIRKSNPKARKSFRARHNCANPGPRTRARYWSCRAW